MKDPEHLIKVEKAIQEKYGDEAIQNPKANWDQEKEKEYLQQIKKIAKSERLKEKIEVNGVLMPKKLFRKESKRTCPECKIYSFNMKDDLYMAKFKRCYECYLKFEFSGGIKNND
jgi:predicted  nucleic acid-binding Zn ribbon protein